MKKLPSLIIILFILGNGRPLPAQDENIIQFKGLVLRPNLILGNSRAENESFGFPASVVSDRDGRIYVADYSKKKILTFSKEGTFLRTIGDNKTGSVGFNGPRSICFDPSGRLFVADTRSTGAASVIVLTEDGTELRTFKIPMIPQKIMIRAESLFVSHRMINFDCNIYEFSLDGRQIRGYENVAGLDEDKAAAMMALGREGTIISAGRFVPSVKKYSRDGKLETSFEYKPHIAHRMPPMQPSSSYRAGKLVIESSEFPICMDVAVDQAGYVFLLVVRDHNQEGLCGLIRIDPSLKVVEDVNLPFLCDRIYIDEANSFYFFSTRRTRCLIRCEASWISRKPLLPATISLSPSRTHGAGNLRGL